MDEINAMQARIMRYLEETYDTIVERPWADDPDCITYKDRLSEKWYALIMPVKAEKLIATKKSAPRIVADRGVWDLSPNADMKTLLGRGKSSGRSYDPDELVPVINVKAETEFIRMISDTPGYQPGYHMNKDHWLTVFLDGSVPYDEIISCIDSSFRLVTDTPTRRIYEAVRQIPKGKVATYAKVAEMAGNPKMCRAVGNALHKNPDLNTIPCYRVVNAKGELAEAFVFGGKNMQEEYLAAEGVEVVNGKVDLSKYGLPFDKL